MAIAESPDHFPLTSGISCADALADRSPLLVRHGWIRMRLRSILKKRRGFEGRGRGIDHQRWPNRYFEKLGLFCLLDARETEIASLRNGANC